jgi:hypothetical protein
MEQQPALQKVNSQPVARGGIESDIDGAEKNIQADLQQGRTGRGRSGFHALIEKDR